MNNQQTARRRSPRFAANKRPGGCPNHSNAAHQSGAVLIISLIMLLLLTLIGASGMQSASLEEKMAGNIRDRNIAFQAAESALRDAELNITTMWTSTNKLKLYSGGPFQNTTAPLCASGFCPLTTPPQYASFSDANWVSYGLSASTAITGLSQQPRYVIELIPSSIILSATYTNVTFQITVRAWGANSSTAVQLQSRYAIKLDPTAVAL